MEKGYFKAGLIVILFTLVLAGCSTKTHLKIYSWIDYIDPSIVEEFENTYNCKVTISVYKNNEEMFENVAESPASYDIICPSGDHLYKLHKRDLLLAIDKSLIPNLSHLDPSILVKNQSYDNELKYGVPYFWGISGIAYNRDYVDIGPTDEVSWNILSDPKFKDSIILLDDMREVIGIALLSLGINPNDTSDSNLTKAYEVINKWRDNGVVYNPPGTNKDLTDNDKHLAMAYNGDANGMCRDFSYIGYSLCKEGSTYWIDSLVIPRESENVELAHEFINYICDPEISARNAEYVRYASPNKTAYDNFISTEMKNNITIYPSEEYLKKCYPINNLGSETSKIDSLWKLLMDKENSI